MCFFLCSIFKVWISHFHYHCISDVNDGISFSPKILFHNFKISLPLLPTIAFLHLSQFLHIIFSPPFVLFYRLSCLFCLWSFSIGSLLLPIFGRAWEERFAKQCLCLVTCHLWRWGNLNLHCYALCVWKKCFCQSATPRSPLNIWSQKELWPNCHPHTHRCGRCKVSLVLYTFNLTDEILSIIAGPSMAGVYAFCAPKRACWAQNTISNYPYLQIFANLLQENDQQTVEIWTKISTHFAKNEALGVPLP